MYIAINGKCCCALLIVALVCKTKCGVFLRLGNWHVLGVIMYKQVYVDAMVYDHVIMTGFSLEIYFQMVHSTIGRYETPLSIKWEARVVTAMGRV